MGEAKAVKRLCTNMHLNCRLTLAELCCCCCLKLFVFYPFCLCLCYFSTSEAKLGAFSCSMWTSIYSSCSFSPSFSRRVKDHVTPEKAHCLGCPREIDENSEDIKLPLSVSISKYNSMSTHTHLFSLHNLGPATQQVPSGWHEGKPQVRTGKPLLTRLFLCPCRLSQALGISWGSTWGRQNVRKLNTKTWTNCASTMQTIW